MNAHNSLLNDRHQLSYKKVAKRVLNQQDSIGHLHRALSVASHLTPTQIDVRPPFRVYATVVAEPDIAPDEVASASEHVQKGQPQRDMQGQRWNRPRRSHT
jgi:hypothetical protein